MLLLTAPTTESEELIAHRDTWEAKLLSLLEEMFRTSPREIPMEDRNMMRGFISDGMSDTFSATISRAKREEEESEDAIEERREIAMHQRPFIFPSAI